MRTTLARFAGAALLATCAMLTVAVPAQAAPIPPAGTGTTLAELENRGFTCGRIGVGGYQCTKGGETWYCDNSKQCEKAFIHTKPAGSPGTGTVVSGRPQVLAR